MTVNSAAAQLLIDAHAHLNAVEQLDRAVQAAGKAGVKQIVAVGMDLASNRETLELAARFPRAVLPAIGYHPWMITPGAIDETLAFIDERLGGCVALGEVGLDYKVKVKKPIQHDVFKRVLLLASARKKPVIVHSRFSYERTYAMVSAAGIETAVFHWYSGPLELLEKIIAAGYYVSATPALAYSRFHQAAIKKAPLERILIETDSPVEYNGRRSEPAHLIETLTALSRVKEMPLADLARISTANAQNFFGIQH